MSKPFVPKIITLPSMECPKTRSGKDVRPPEQCLSELSNLLDKKEEHLNKLNEIGESFQTLGSTLKATVEDGLTESVKQIAKVQKQPPELYPEHVNKTELMNVLIDPNPTFEVILLSKLKPKLYRRRQFEYALHRIIAQFRSLTAAQLPMVSFEVQVFSTVHPIKKLEMNSKETPLLLYNTADSDASGRIELKRLTFTEDTCAFPYEKVHLALVALSRRDVHPLILEDLHVSTPRKKY